MLTRSLRDSARILDAIAGAEMGGPFAIGEPARPYAEEISRSPGVLRIGYSTQSPLGTPVHAQCLEAVERTARLLESLGHRVEPAQPAVDGHALARSFITMYFGQAAASIA